VEDEGFLQPLGLPNAGSGIIVYKIKGWATFTIRYPQRHGQLTCQDSCIILDNIEIHGVWKNVALFVEDLGDGILNVAFSSKMTPFGGDVFGAEQAMMLAEKVFQV